MFSRDAAEKGLPSLLLFFSNPLFTCLRAPLLGNGRTLAFHGGGELDRAANEASLRSGHSGRPEGACKQALPT